MGKPTIPTSLDLAALVDPNVVSGPVYLNADLVFDLGTTSLAPAAVRGSTYFDSGSGEYRMMHGAGAGPLANGLAISTDGVVNFRPADSITGEIFALCDETMDRDLRMRIRNRDNAGNNATAEYETVSERIPAVTAHGIRCGSTGNGYAAGGGLTANCAFVSTATSGSANEINLIIQSHDFDVTRGGYVIFQVGGLEQARLNAQGLVTGSTAATTVIQGGATLRVFTKGVASTGGIQIDERTDDPTIAANGGYVYTKDVAGTTELFYRASDATVTQLTPAGGATPWQTTGTVTNLVTSTDEVTIGSANNLAKLAVDGDADQVQFLVQAVAGQSVDLVVFEDSAGTNLFTFDGTGLGFELNSGGILLNERADHAYTPAAGKGELWVKNDAPNVLYFTDDAGTDHNLLAGGSGQDFNNMTADTPAQITSNQNNYAVDATDPVIRLSSDADGRQITGIVAQANKGRWLLNVGSNTIILVHDSGSSSAANRFDFVVGEDLTIDAGDCVFIWYDSTDSRWKAFC
jgi:hypothetical protein